MLFDIYPYSGAGSISFGMSESDVQERLGPPLRINKNRRGETVFHYDEFNATFEAFNSLAEITFYPGVKVVYGGRNIFECTGISSLRSIDSNILEYVGVLFFPIAGITLSGFHNDEDRTITAFSSGRLDHLLPKFQPFPLKGSS